MSPFSLLIIIMLRELWPQSNIEFYNGDNNLPVFMKHNKTYRFTVERLCCILLDTSIDSELVCKAQPTRVAYNVTFVVDCSYLADRKDLFVDDLGVWISKGSRKTSFSTTISPGCVSINIDSDQTNLFIMHRTWQTHGTSEDVRKLVVFIEGVCVEGVCMLCLLKVCVVLKVCVCVVFIEGVCVRV